MNNKVSIIEGKVTLVGEGLINFSGDEGKFLYNAYTSEINDIKNQYQKFNNRKYSKARYSFDENGIPNRIPVISSNCNRHTIFKDDIPYSNINAIYSSTLDKDKFRHLLTPAYILRGYTVMDNGLTKKSPIWTGCSFLSNKFKTTFETNTTSGARETSNKKKDDEGNTSMHSTETCGKTIWKFNYKIDISELRFISCSETFGRMSWKSDWFINPNNSWGFDELNENFKKLSDIFSFPCDEIKEFTKLCKGVVTLEELGIDLGENNTKLLVMKFLSDITKYSVTRNSSGGIAEFEKMTIIPKHKLHTSDNVKNEFKEISFQDIKNLEFNFDYYKK